MASSTSDITLAFGATTVTISTITAQSIHPTRRKNFSVHVLEDNSRVFDVAGNTKRVWNLENVVPLTTAQKTTLDTLYDLEEVLTLTEEFIDSTVAYSVFFEDFNKRLDTPQGDDKFRFVIQEV